MSVCVCVYVRTVNLAHYLLQDQIKYLIRSKLFQLFVGLILVMLKMEMQNS